MWAAPPSTEASASPSTSFRPTAAGELVDGTRASAGLNDSKADQCARVPRAEARAVEPRAGSHSPLREPTIFRPSSIMTSPLETVPKPPHADVRYRRSSDEARPPGPTRPIRPRASAQVRPSQRRRDRRRRRRGDHQSAPRRRPTTDRSERRAPRPARPPARHLDAGTGSPLAIDERVGLRRAEHQCRSPGPTQGNGAVGRLLLDRGPPGVQLAGRPRAAFHSPAARPGGPGQAVRRPRSAAAGAAAGATPR